MKFGKLYRKSPQVNMIPIINVIFLLLIFFLTTSNLKKVDPVAVTPPVSSSGNIVGMEAAELYLTADKLMLENEVVTAQTLVAKLTSKGKKLEQTTVLLKADATVDSVKLIEIMKILKKAGIKNLYMVTSKG